VSRLKLKLKKGDTVLIRRGKDRGKTGEIIAILPKLNKVVVEGANIVKRARKASSKNPKGGIDSMPRPIAISNVGLPHPDDKKRTSRIGYEIVNKKKVRVFRQAGNKKV
jgi:large subunit ribosomal protein L24